MTSPPPPAASDDDVISPEALWRFARSLFHPVFFPRSYFERQAARPQDYLRAKQALALLFLATWLADQRVDRTFKERGLIIDSSQPSIAFVLLAWKAAISVVLVYGTPFFVHFGARAVRASLSWADATRIAAFGVPFSLLGAGVQLATSFRPAGIAVSVLLGLGSLTFAYGRVARVSLTRGAAGSAVDFFYVFLTSSVLALLMALGLYFSGAGMHPPPEPAKIGLRPRSGSEPCGFAAMRSAQRLQSAGS
jgi:hypothetical protein